MSSNIWNVVQTSNTTTQEVAFGMLTSSGSGYAVASTAVGSAAGTIGIASSVRVERDPLKRITSACKEMLADFVSIERDQNQYAIELEEIEYEYGIFNNDINAEIAQLMSEIKRLEIKEQNGTITEDEQKELADKKNNLDVLFKKSNEKRNDINSDLKSKQESLAAKYLQKQDIALDYGNQAIDKGCEVAQMSVDEALKSDLNPEVRSLADVAKYYTHRRDGIEAVHVGSELVDKVTESGERYNTISKRKMK